jgi:hypothetical protein
MQKFLTVEWEAIAGILAALIALVMHFLHVVEEEVLLVIAVVLLSLSFIRDLRRERLNEHMRASLEQTERGVQHLQATLSPPDTILIGPRRLRAESEGFSRYAQGEMIWFHVCLSMFKPQPLFDALLRPAIENPRVTAIQFILDEDQRDVWTHEVAPKVATCVGKEKVKEPCWTSIRENVSFILSDSGADGTTECLLSFWGEPFMARSTERDVPRYIFRVQGHSEVVARLVELERSYRFST